MTVSCASLAGARILVEGRPSGADHPEGTRDRFWLLVLAEESRDADLLRFRHHRRISDTGKDHDLCLRNGASYRPGDIEAAAVWEAQIEQAGIGTVLDYGRDAIAGTCCDGQYRMTACLEHRSESLAQNAVTVTQDNSHLWPSLPSGTLREAAMVHPPSAKAAAAVVHSFLVSGSLTCSPRACSAHRMPTQRVPRAGGCGDARDGGFHAGLNQGRVIPAGQSQKL